MLAFADRGFQGWVEADLIFVGPDEAGRVETLSVREGDAVAKGAPLFTVDPDLQRADVEMAKASLTNARQAFERAAGAAQDRRRHPEDGRRRAGRAAHCGGAVVVGADPAGAPQMSAPVSGTVQQIYYRPGELVPAGRPVLSLLPPGNIKIRFFVPEATLPKIELGEPVTVHCDGCKADVPARVTFISRIVGIYTAGDLQPG